MNRKMKMASIVLNLISGIWFLVDIIVGHNGRIWTGITLGLFIVVWTTFLAYPQYFSFMEKKNTKEEVYNLMPAIIWSGCTTVLGIIKKFYYPDWRKLIGWSIIFVILMIILIYVRLKEVRRMRSLFFALVVLITAFSGGIIGNVNHLTNFNDSSVEAGTIIEKRRVGKMSYFLIQLESEEYVEIPISGVAFAELGVGDYIEVHNGEGGLDIRYTYIKR